jgi:UDP-N-acetylglucosamine 2-epimerase (non-hydrolysing)
MPEGCTLTTRSLRSPTSSGATRNILHAVGTRPNFVKVAPVVEALTDATGIRQVIIHTGQHYDDALSRDVLEDLGFPAPDRFLGVRSGTHGEQTANALIAFERVLFEERPDLVVVAGDVNSTLACALAAVKLGIPIAHVESGLRSRDWTMPEEINRVLTDRVSTLLFTHSPEAADNLALEGVERDRIHYVGNTMIDSLRRFEAVARQRARWRSLGLDEGAYVLVTLHRPSNVDDPVRLSAIVDALIMLGSHAPVVFPIHPRTRARLESTGELDRLSSAPVHALEPLGYLDFLSLETAAGAILTDSGGIQEEAAALGVRCYTFRKNTERPVTVELGTNCLIGDDPAAITTIRVTPPEPGRWRIPLWDGRAGRRIAEVLTEALRPVSVLTPPATARATRIQPPPSRAHRRSRRAQG